MTVCSHIDCQSHVFSPYLEEYAGTNSNDIIEESKLFFWIICSVSEMYIKFWKFWKRLTLIVCVFSKLETWKDVVSQISKNLHLRTPFDSQHVKGTQTLPKSARQHFYHIFSRLLKKFGCEMSLLVISDILGRFANMLTSNEVYSPHNNENLRQPI